MVPVKQLCSALVPLHVLNEEVVLTRDDKNALLKDNGDREAPKEDFHLEEVQV